MREIRFRAKTVVRKQWAHGSLITYPDGSADIHGVDILRTGSQHIEFMQVDRETACQFTGMRDKHGVKIFEGDIVEVYDFTSVYASKYRGVVKMYRGSWCVEYEDSIFDTVFHPMLFFDDFADRKTEVIGNVYDNPELLNKK